MKKIFAYFLVNLVTKNPDKSIEIVNMFLGNTSKVINASSGPVLLSQTPKKSTQSKQHELETSLSYLKSKRVKTKQDKDSIYTLEMILKNMK